MSRTTDWARRVAVTFAFVLVACSSTSDQQELASSGAGTGGDANVDGGTGSAWFGNASTVPPEAGASTAVEPPPSGGLWDYQIGGPYAPAQGVTVVSRDHGASPAPGVYSICYVNGFQAQPEEKDIWLQHYSDLVLRDHGEPVIDEDWNEMVLDVGTDEKRRAIVAIVDGWFADCAAKGFRAVEIDNLDSYARSKGHLTVDDCVAMEHDLSVAAHARGLAVGQKNASEMAARRSDLGTDFVVAEECNRYDECDAYTAVYGGAVLSVEYRSLDFAKGCARAVHGPTVLRDRNVSPAGAEGYVYSQCP